MIRVAICDDDSKSREILEKHTRRFFENGTLGDEMLDIQHFISGKKFLEKVRDQKESFQLVLLDIEMQDTDGLVVKEWLEQWEDTQILFVTNYEKYAISAYGFRVFGFLKKPVQYMEFARAIKPAWDELRKKTRCISVDVWNGTKRILLRDINYIRPVNKYSVFYMRNGRQIDVREKYRFLTEQLREADFVEIKKGWLINMANVESLNGRNICMENGQSIQCSFRKQKEIQNIFYMYVKEHAR